MSLKHNQSRRGVIAVLAAVLSVMMLAMLAFAIDVGYLSLSKTQLQAAADASALAAASRIGQADMVSAAQTLGACNTVGGRPVKINTSDVETGVWDSTALTFTPSVSTINSVRVTARTGASNGGATPMFFARVLGWNSLDQKASAVATVNPRDIAFVVDLSASMNYDTRPAMDNSSTSQAYIQRVFDNFGFGTYTRTSYTTPSSSQWAGYTLTSKKTAGPTWSTSTDQLVYSSCWVNDVIYKLKGTAYKTTIYYTGGTITTTEQIRRAYAWVMDKQLKVLMPNAIPAINSTSSTSYTYWKDYIDFPRNSDTLNHTTSSSQYPYHNYTRLGYASYVQYMMFLGRDSTTYSGSYTAMSVNNTADCPYHTDDTDAGPKSFPPEERPTHSARIAIIDAIQIVKTRNTGITDKNQRDWVSIVTYDKASGTQIVKSLTDDYDAVMDACRKLQACGSGPACTHTEGGIVTAHDHIRSTTEGGSGRTHVNKILVLLTDGAANLKSSDSATITNYMTNNPSDYWLTNTSSYSYWPEQAAMMQVHKYQGANWFTYPVGLGLDIDDNFMDNMACIAGTADKDGQSMSSTDPATAIADLKNIFSQIITRPKLRLVK